ncbi:type II toxin-antitoxin system prevent-host-death family antitoxin [Candidatus Peregrinibacteria bacterium]|nr:MAG: type II toxin-antitoxin system prevent-host-death family antitoxin [Candidatus Peregrinibacteria bacterium]
MNSTTTYTKARKNLKTVFDAVCSDHGPCLVERREGGNIVLVSEEDFNSLEETAYLLSSPSNLKHIATSLKELENGKTVEFDLPA